MATTWGERVKPETSWNKRVKPDTSWGVRINTNTSWGIRGEVDTDRTGRNRPITYKAPLQDAYRIVHDEDDEIIYILSNSGKLIPATFWGTRPKVD